jgi:hypothetical protein
LVVVVELHDAIELSGTIEIAPTKLRQVGEYQQMLSDITSHAAEAVLQGFAPTTLRAAAGPGSAELLYQRFAMLESQLHSDQFAASVAHILENPDVAWRTVADQQSPGGAFPHGPDVGRAFAAPGPRRPWPGNRNHPALTTMPTKLARSRQEATPDTAANRFIKYALESWRDLAHSFRDGFAPKSAKRIPGPVRRGLQAADRVIDLLNDILTDPIFREIGSLDRFPASSQVLQKQQGYRQLLRLFVLVDAGLELPWASDSEGVYSPSLRDIAKLYEIWCYLTLVDVVGRVCGQLQTGHAFESSTSGLSLKLRRGAHSTVEWRTVRRGRLLEIRLMFNRYFTGEDETWTKPMQPDCSILIRPLPSISDSSLDVWVHFDAKYRVDGSPPITFSAENDDDDGDDESLPRGSARRDDLLKMHAYRDAIHKTAGAYILYPGDKTLVKEQFAETLPGLGAFPLRPGADETHGAKVISDFLIGVLDHVADQATQHERERFWRARIYRSTPQQHPSLPPVGFLDRPPADTVVLLGYVRGAQHRAWIERTKSYNVRADGRAGSVQLGGRELGARLVLLYEKIAGKYGVVALARPGEWRAVDRQELLSSGYSRPRGRLYLVTTLELIPDPPPWLFDIAIDPLRPDGAVRAAPFAVTWLDLMSTVRRAKRIP